MLDGQFKDRWCRLYRLLIGGELEVCVHFIPFKRWIYSPLSLSLNFKEKIYFLNNLFHPSQTGHTHTMCPTPATVQM